MKVGLRWVMGLCCLLLAPPGVLADTGQSADMRVWSVVYQQGEGQVSEIWVHHNGEDRAVGILPGRAERLVPLDASHFRCDVAAITLPFFGSPGRHVWALAPPTSWEIGLDRSCREIERVAPGETPPSIAPVGHDSASKRVMQVLGGVEEALHHARMAYSYLHQWDFRNASEGYHTASQKVKPGRFSGGQVLGPPFEKMAEGLESLAVEAKKEGPRRVCRDHLQMLGEWALTYRSAHGMFWPEDAAVLCDWIDSRGGDNRLFRSPEDRGAQRRFSYLYRPQAQVGEAVFISPFYQGRILELVKTEAGFRVLDRVAGKAQVDSLLAAGRSQLEPAEAVAIFSMVTRIDPTSAEGFSQLGYACLRAGDVDRARASFEQAVDIDHRLASAYNGLGLVFENHPKGRYDAIRFFRRAIQYDEEFVEARFNMARMRFALKEHDAKRDLDRVIALDQNYAPAFLLLGEWYEALEEDYGNAAVAYARYLALRPDDAEGRRRLAATYVRTQDFDKVTSLLEVYAREHPNEVEILPILAQACMDQDRLDWAQAYFSTYVRSAPDSLGRCYSDIRLLATAEEQAEYGALDPEARERYLREFWSVRDPNLTTAANERQLEHYRRVWYSLTNYSNGRRPWDRRGEVYIRFGEPDYRSRSDMVNMKQNLAVQRVKDRMAQTLYGMEATQLSYFGPVFPVRGLGTRLSGTPDWRGEIPAEAMDGIMESREEARQTQMGGEESRSVANTQATGDDQTGFSEEAMGRIATMDVVTTGPSNSAVEMAMGGGRSGPSRFSTSFQSVGVGEDASMVRWESWVYSDIGGGIEITFTDEAMNGNYDYAPPPMDASIPIRKLALFNRYKPESVTELASRMVPDHYVTPDNSEPLQFYYDVVDFRSEVQKQSALEVYTGVPRAIGHYGADEDTTRLVVERVVALVDAESGDVYRRTGQIRFAGRGDLRQPPGAFVPDVVRLDAPPGNYRMEVMLKDRLSGRQGRYRQDVVIENYDDRGLKVSDLQLAWQVSETGPDDKFRKGELHVVPMPTRTFGQGQNVFVYYEIYNLSKDAFGQSNYQVAYTVGARDDGLVGGVVAQLVKVFAGEKNQVAVGYEQVSKKDSETAYTELDLGDCKPGRYALMVVVTDMNSGKKTKKEAFFMVAK